MASRYHKNSDIANHVCSYLSNGGDIDIFVTHRKFEEATGIHLDGSDEVVWNMSTIRIESVASGYEISAIMKNLKRKHDYEVEDYGLDKVWNDTASSVFPTRQFRLIVSGGCDLQQTVNFDIIAQVEHTAELRFENCDFGCNALMMTTNGIVVKNSIVKLDECLQQIRDRKIVVLKSEGKSQKLIYRLVHRIKAGCELDVTNDESMRNVVGFLYNATDMHRWYLDDDDRSTKKQRALDEMYFTFMKQQCADILSIFIACRKQLIVFICENITTNPDRLRSKMSKKEFKVQREYYDKRLAEFKENPCSMTLSGIANYQTLRLLEYFQDLCVRHNQYPQFLMWARPIPYWKAEFDTRHVLEIAVKYCPESIKKTVFQLCHFTKNEDAFHFIVLLMKHNRTEILLDYLKNSKNGKKTIRVFNSRSNAEKCRSQMMMAFVLRHYYDDEGCDAKYLSMLEKCGFEMPTKVEQESWCICEQSVEWLDFYWTRSAINFRDLFPDEPKKEDMWNYKCLSATGPKLKWLLNVVSKKYPISMYHVNLMLKQCGKHHFDFEFLQLYKSFCIGF